jgi:hypothetical protein
MVNPKNAKKDFIRYVVAVKTFEGEGLDIGGKISVYE